MKINFANFLSSVSICFMILTSGLLLSAQNPELEKVVHEVIDKYQKAPALDLDFQFELTFPEQEPELFNGRFFRIGDQYLVDLDEYTLNADGKFLSTTQEKNKEVQITSLDDESMELSSPSGILKYLSDNEFKYFDKSELKQGGQPLRIIEMIPEDRTSDYFIIRFRFVEEEQKLKYIEIFARDGTRVQLTVEKSDFAAKFSPQSITWDEEKYRIIIMKNLGVIEFYFI